MYYPTRVTAHLPPGGTGRPPPPDFYPPQRPADVDQQQHHHQQQQQQQHHHHQQQQEVAADPLRAGVTAASSDAYYKAKLRAGFIDLRNSYNENRPRPNKGPGQASSSASTRGLSSKSSGGQVASAWKDSPTTGSNHSPVLNRGSPVRTLAERRGLFRSNSSLELDRLDLPDHDPGLRRDYGSANSLDVMSTSSDGFFAMLQDFKNDNTDQRAPAPPQMHEVLRGPPVKSPTSPRPVSSPESSASKLPNGGTLILPDDDSADGSHSPRPKQKSQKSKDRKQRTKSVVGEGSGGIFKKLRGKGEGEAASKSHDATTPESEPSRIEERQKKKALVHYDCQSICVNFADVIKRKNSLNRRKNVTTGASAASGVRNAADSEQGEGGEEDGGDDKSNDLVLNCSYFRNELGVEEERTIALNKYTERVRQCLQSGYDVRSLNHRPACNGVAILDTSIQPSDSESEPPVISHKGLIVEHVDHGALYYQHFFYGFEHQNFFGNDENLGPVAVSLKREKVDDRDVVSSRGEGSALLYQYRIIIRTSELQTLRGVVLEDAIPSSSRLSSSRGLPARDVLEFVSPEFPLSCLKLATPGQKTSAQLMKLDEQGRTDTYKIGIMYCRAGQSTEEDMYNNEHAGPIFDSFLDCIGNKVRLKGFEKYRGGLDCKTDSTGTHSLYAQLYNYEIMFHVSTMLPHTPNNRQQLLRKRHIGNDIVTIVFQEPGSLPFTPKTVRSHFQHVFIIVRAHSSNTSHFKYSVAVSRSKDVPSFGPPIREGAMFDRSPEFAEFLLMKAINAENAAHKSEKFIAMATRTRQEYLKDLASNFATSTSLESASKFSKFSLGSGRKKERTKLRCIPDLWSPGAVVWSVLVEDFAQQQQLECHLGVAAKMIVLVEDSTREVIFTMMCESLIAWTPNNDSLKLYYEKGECVSLRVASADPEEVSEVVSRLAVVTEACQTQDVTLRRNSTGQLGFVLHYEGLVADVEPHGFAWQAGLRQGSRLVEICKVATATLSHDEMIDLLRTSLTVKVTVVPPHEDGSPRRGWEDLHLGSSSSMGPPQRSSSSEMVHRDDDSSASTSSHSTVIQAAHSSGKLGTRPHDIRGQLPDSARYVNYNSDTLHSKTSSHDSTGSRSSGHGSMEGHHNEGHNVSRSDNISSEGFGSGDDHSRQAFKENGEGSRDWTRSAAAYNYQQAQDTSGTAFQQAIGSMNDHSWFPSEMDGHHHGYPTPFSSSSSSRTKYLPKTTAAMPPAAYSDKLNKSSYGLDPNSNQWYDRGALGATSTSNLSDLSSQSGSGGSLRHGHKSHPYTEQQQPKAEDLVGRGAGVPPLSPTMRRHQSAFHTPPPRRLIDASPHSSNSGSPKSSRRTGATSEDNLSGRARPKASPVSMRQTGQSAANFQEELMRLIDPDVSLAELESSLARVSNYLARNAGKKPGVRPLQRTLSDESMCNPRTQRKNHSMEQLSNDVIFSSANPAGKDPRLSPNENNVTPPRSIATRVSSSPLLPLPDGTCGPLDWSHLVDTATRAFEDECKQNEGDQMGMKMTKSESSQGHHSHQGHQGHSGHHSGHPLSHQGSKSSKSDSRDAPVPYHSQSQSQSHQSHPLSQLASWRGSSSNPQIVQELEMRVAQLQLELEKERQQRAALEAEVQQLRQDNARLQEESQTAATQLRKFTEWFFNTIDRQ